MSLDSLLLVAFLIVLPLLERLVRVLRARAQPRTEKPAVSPPHRERTASIPSPVSMPPVLPPRHPAAERLSAGERVRARRRSEQATAVLPAGGGSVGSRARHVLSHTKPADLRRAMMLVAILGPCKALEGETGSVSGRT